MSELPRMPLTQETIKRLKGYKLLSRKRREDDYFFVFSCGPRQQGERWPPVYLRLSERRIKQLRGDAFLNDVAKELVDGESRSGGIFLSYYGAEYDDHRGAKHRFLDFDLED